MVRLFCLDLDLEFSFEFEFDLELDVAWLGSGGFVGSDDMALGLILRIDGEGGAYFEASFLIVLRSVLVL